MSEPGDSVRRSGYLSEESKKRFTIVTGILGAVFFMLQIFGPMVVMFATMPAMMFGTTFKLYAVDGAALYRGEVHLLETMQGFGDPEKRASKSRLVKVGQTGIEEVAPLGGWQPRLLADEDRLWLVSSTRMAVYDGRELRPLELSSPLGDTSPPFLFEGVPAVVESRPEGDRLMAWHAEGWRKVRDVSGVGGACCVQLLSDADGVLVLRESGRSLFARSLDDEEEEWAVVASKPSHWRAFIKDGKPAVVSSSPEEGLRVVELEGNRWTQVATTDESRAFPESVAAFQSRPGVPLILLSSSFPGSLRLRTWGAGHVSDERRLGHFSPFPGGFTAMMWLPHVGTMALSLVLAVILSMLMRAHRVSVFVHEGIELAHASLTRRALSQMVDTASMAAPAIVLLWRTFEDFGQFFESPGVVFRIFGYMAGAVLWSLVVLVGFSLSEGRWGVTPGKWLTGIRVVGTDLAPCGFGRALVRNLLKFVDGFFNFLVGMLMVAYTPEWQRLGDLAARTIVVRTPAGGVRSLRPSTLMAAWVALLCASTAWAEPPRPSTFSIVAADPEAGEVGVAVASRFFAVGSVVPWARAGIGAVATQSNANTTFGPRGLELLERGLKPQEVLDVLLRADAGRDKRQVGTVSADGASATYTGTGCTAWAGGRHGPGYAVQGNILAGEAVVVALEKRFLETKGRPLAERLLEALVAGDAAGGDRRGRQSAALLVVRDRGGYNGFTDRAVDVRVDDHADPIGEIARITRLALVNDAWNRGWTAFTEKRYPEALRWQRKTVEMAERSPALLPEVLYDLAVILQANGASDEAWAALQRAISLNPNLREQALGDGDLTALRAHLRD